MTNIDLAKAQPFNGKTYGLAVLAYFVVTLVVAAIWHFALFADLYTELAIYTREAPIVPLGMSSMLVQGLIMAYAYPKICRRMNPMKEGLVFGLICGIFIASAAVLGEAGKQNVTSLSTFLILESVFYALLFSLSGLAIALVYGKSSN